MADDSLVDVCIKGNAKTPTLTNLKGQKIITIVPMDHDKYTQDLYDGTVWGEGGYLFHYMKASRPSNIEDYKEWLKQNNVGKNVMFAIIENNSGKAVGHCSYIHIDEHNRRLEIGGIMYSSALQRTIGATEAMYLMAKHAFDDLGYSRYQWCCNSMNKKSMNAAYRLGFTYEGVLRNYWITKGHSFNSAHFSILVKEWPFVKQSMEQWLSSDNFDDQGQQIHSLSNIRAKIQSDKSL